MSKNDLELFPAEFRHEVVTKLIRGLADGTMTLDYNAEAVKRQKKKGRDYLALTTGKLIEAEQRYCSGKYKGAELDEIEQTLFNAFTELRLVGIIKETYTTTKVEEDIARLNARLDSTNNLLIEVLALLKKITDVFDNLGKSD